MNLNNCEQCGASYSPYKPGDRETDLLGYWCEVSSKPSKTKGLCSFCNPKGMFYNKYATTTPKTERDNKG